MNDFLVNNYGNIIVIILLLIATYFVIKKLIKDKGGCAYCKKHDTCPIAKIYDLKNKA